jgi:hypothetical protein
MWRRGLQAISQNYQMFTLSPFNKSEIFLKSILGEGRVRAKKKGCLATAL